MPNATSGAHVEGIVRHNLDRIDARQAIVLSNMAEDFCSSSATSDERCFVVRFELICCTSVVAVRDM